MGAVDLVIQVESPLSVARGLQRVGRAGHRVGEPSRGVIFPKYRGDLLEAAVVTRLMHEGAIEPTVVPRNPLDVLAQQLVAMTARPRLAGRRALRARAPRGELRGAGPRRLRGDAGHARRPVPGRRVRGAAAAPRLGPRGGHGRRRAAMRARWRSPRAARSPTAASSRSSSPTTRRPDGRGPGRAPGRRAAAAGASASWTRRWSTRRARARSSCWAPAPGASSPSSTTACSSRRRPASRARCPSGRATASGRPVELGRALGAFTREIWRAGRRGHARPRGGRCAGSREHHDLDELAAANLLGYLEEEQRGHGRPAHRPDDRPAALPRRAGRLAHLPPDAVRGPRPRALGAGHRGAPAGGAGRGGAAASGPTTASSCACRPPMTAALALSLAPSEPTAIGSRRARPERPCGRWRAQRGGGRAHRLGRGRGAGDRRGRRLGALRQPLPGERGAGPAAAAAPPGPAHAALADAPARRRSCSRWPAATAPSRSSSRPTGRCLQRRLRPARPARASWRAIERREIRVVSVETRARLALRLARCCSTTSPPTCTRATRRCSTGAPRRWRWTATCCASCWAPSSCASCSMPTRSRSWSWSCRRSTPERAAGSADGVHDLLRRLGDLTADGGRRPGARGGRGRAAARGRRVAGGARGRPARRPRAHRRGGALDRSGGRRPLPRRGGRRACRAGVPGRVPGARPRTRWAACWRAGRAATARSSRMRPARAGGCRAASWRPALERLMARGRAAARRVPARRRGARVVRPGGAAAPAAPLAGAAAPRDRAGGAGGAGALPAGLAGRRQRGAAASTGWPRSSPSWRACRCRPASWSGTSCRRACAATTRSMLDELGAAGEVVWVGAGTLGRDDGRDRAVPAGPPGAAAAARDGDGCRGGRSAEAPPRSGWLHDGPARAPRGARRLLLPRAAGRGAPGRARPAAGRAAQRAGGAGRALGPRLGRRGHATTRSLPLRALRWPRRGGRIARGRRRARGHGRAWGRRRRPAAGRWSRTPSRTASRSPAAGRPRRPSGAPPWRCACWSATGS